MNKVYRHKPLAADEYLGHVAFDGKVYETRFGPDKFVGHVELDSGKIYGPGINNYLGQVMLDSGKVYRHKPLAADEYLGQMADDGKLYRHKIGPDEYIGQIEGTNAYALGGAAFMLLVWPMVEGELKEQQEMKKGKETGEQGETGENK